MPSISSKRLSLSSYRSSSWEVRPKLSKKEQPYPRSKRHLRKSAMGSLGSMREKSRLLENRIWPSSEAWKNVSKLYAKVKRRLRENQKLSSLSLSNRKASLKAKKMQWPTESPFLRASLPKRQKRICEFLRDSSQPHRLVILPQSPLLRLRKNLSQLLRLVAVDPLAHPLFASQYLPYQPILTLQPTRNRRLTVFRRLCERN